MVAHLVRLKLALLVNGFRRSVAAIIGMVVGILYGGVFVALAVAGLVSLRFQGDLGLAHTAVVLGGAALVLGWALLPIVMFGIDPTLDPSRFATFAVPERTLAAGLVVCGLVGVPGVATVVLVLASVVSASRTLAGTALALVGGVVGLATCLLLSRIVTGVASAILSTRRGRDVIGVVGLVTILCLAPLSSYLGDRGFGRSTLDDLAAVVAWTPLAWAWAPGPDANLGHEATALVRLLLALALAGVLFLVWERILVSVLRNPRTSSGDGGTTRSGLGLLGRLPATPMGAIAGRAGTYWIRDPRFNFPGLMTAALPAGLLVPGLGSHSDLALVAMPLASAYLIGWGQHNDVGYDSTAFWMHVASGVDGVSDRLGRLFPSGVLAAVCIPVYSVLGAWLSGRWGLLPASLGVSIALVLNGFAVACMMSAIKQYAVPSPGESPFSSRPGSVGVTLGVQAICGTAVIVLSLPAIVFGVAAWYGTGWAAWVALGVGTVLGVVTLGVGATRGGALFDRRQADLLQDLVAMR